VRVQDADDVGFLEHQMVDAIDLDFGAGPLAEQHAIAGPDVERMDVALRVAGARTDRDDLGLLRLLLCGIGNDDAAFRLRFLLEALDDDAVVQRTE